MPCCAAQRLGCCLRVCAIAAASLTAWQHTCDDSWTPSCCVCVSRSVSTTTIVSVTSASVCVKSVADRHADYTCQPVPLHTLTCSAALLGTPAQLLPAEHEEWKDSVILVGSAPRGAGGSALLLVPVFAVQVGAPSTPNAPWPWLLLLPVPPLFVVVTWLLLLFAR